MEPMKQPYYMGEVIGANIYDGYRMYDYQMYDVVYVEKTTWQVPKGWVVAIKSRSDGEHHEFYLGGDNFMWDLIQMVEERLWNL
jgi:hypothetical protein